MRLVIVLGALALATAIAAANNLFNAHLPWLGSPALLRQNPWDIIEEPYLTGFFKGLRYSVSMVRSNATWVYVCAGGAMALSLGARFARGASWSAILAAWFRIAMAAMLVAACWYKLQSPADFAAAVAQYQMLPKPLVNSFALWLPALELVVAIGLVASPWTREMYALLTVMWLMFIGALGWALWHRLGITCGCFALKEAYGSTAESWFSLIRDVVLLFPTLWLTFAAKQRYWWARDRTTTGAAPAPFALSAT